MAERLESSAGADFWAKVPGKARKCSALAFACWLTLAGAQTPTPPVPPASPALEARLKKLETELRCLVCQNQTLAESPAGLAGDLRREVRLLADQGKSDEEIKAHLQARYGDFVLYKPPVESKTWLLWFGPFALLAVGAIVTVLVARRNRPAAAAPAGEPLSDSDRQRADRLLDE